MADQENLPIEDDASDVISDTDLFKSLSDLTVAPADLGATGGYKVSPLVDGTVRVKSSMTITKALVDDSLPGISQLNSDPDLTKSRKSRTKTKAKVEDSVVDETQDYSDEENITTIRPLQRVTRARSLERITATQRMAMRNPTGTLPNTKVSDPNLIERADSWETMPDGAELTNVEMMRAIKTMLATNQESINERVDKVKHVLNKNINDLDISIDKHLITRYQSLDDKITSKLDLLEKSTKKRSLEIEKKAENFNKKITAQIQKTCDSESSHFREIKKLATQIDTREQSHYESIKDRMDKIETQFVNHDDLRNDLENQKVEIQGNIEELQEKVANCESKIPDMTEFQTTLDRMKTSYMEIEREWEEKKRMMERVVTEAQNAPINEETLAPIRTELNTVRTNSNRANSRIDHIDTDKKLPNLIITGLPNRYQSIPGVCRFAIEEMGVEIQETDVACMYIIVETAIKTMFLARFTNQRARNNFYRGRLQLTPRSRIWINEDLSRAKETLSYEARLRYLGNKIHRCWTFNGNVFILVTENSEPIRIDQMEDFPLNTALDPETDRRLRRPRGVPRNLQEGNERPARYRRNSYNPNRQPRLDREGMGGN